MNGHEHRDVYIALGVAGVVLVLIYLYLYGGATTPVGPDGNPLPSTTTGPDVAQTPYNYNVTPYNPSPHANYTPQSINPLNSGCSGCSGSQRCGVSGMNSTNVTQFSLLIGGG
ncbi:MAG: hypothetical protein KGJ13_06545 [Patescibacteria group bacterium]|nr:hypothetical protein [Patescibacteria group bacterium]